MTTDRELKAAKKYIAFLEKYWGIPDRLENNPATSAEREEYLAATRPHLPEGGVRPKIVCLCGSTRFWREFQRASLRETMEGRIVLSIGAASGTDDEHFGNLPREEYDRIKTMLDELHKRKIDLADEVLVLNVDGYVGSSTRSEIEYAEAHGKPIRFLETSLLPQQERKGE